MYLGCGGLRAGTPSGSWPCRPGRWPGYVDDGNNNNNNNNDDDNNSNDSSNNNSYGALYIYIYIHV